MTLREIEEASIEIFPQYEDYIRQLIIDGSFWALYEFLQTSPKSKETLTIRRALMKYIKE